MEKIIGTIKTVFQEFFKEKSLMHGAALAYYGILALVPFLYLCVTVAGRLIGQKTMVTIISDILQKQVGISDVSGIIGFLKNVDLSSGNFLLEIIGLVALLFSSTAILTALRGSLNEFYDLDLNQLSRKKQIVRGIFSKLISMGFVVGVTVLIMVLYFGQTILLSLSSDWLKNIEWLNSFFSQSVQFTVPILMNTIVFAFVFKYLNDGVVLWKFAIRGALLTSGLMFLGQLFIQYYLSHYFFGARGGVAGSFLVILVWMYYSSQIIFLGAKFIHVWSKNAGEQIEVR